MSRRVAAINMSGASWGREHPSITGKWGIELLVGERSQTITIARRVPLRQGVVLFANEAIEDYYVEMPLSEDSDLDIGLLSFDLWVYGLEMMHEHESPFETCERGLRVWCAFIGGGAE